MFKIFILIFLPFILVADMLDYYSMAILPSIIAKQKNEQNSKVYGLAGTHTVAEPWDEPTGSETTVYFPSDINTTHPTPVIFFAPGWNSTEHTDYKTLLRFIASHGYSVVYAKDENKFSSTDMIEDFITMAEHEDVAPYIDTSKIGVIGHSIGGGHVFNILDKLSDTKGWGANGRFIFSIEPWFAFDMNRSDMQTLPTNTNVVIQEYGEGGNNNASGTDPRIPLTEYYLLDSIDKKQKDYQIFVDADHTYPYGDGNYSDMQGILKPLDALMEYTFKNQNNETARQASLELGNDDPYNGGFGIQVVYPKSDYAYPCDDYNFTAHDISHCLIDGYPPSSEFDAIATNNSIEQPDYMASYLDPEFNTTVTRITDRINQTGNAHPYPKTQAWNSDMSMFRLGYRLYNANTFEELAITSGENNLSKLYYINGALSEMKWSNVNPDVFYGIWSNEFWKATIHRDTNTITFDLIHRFNESNYDKFTLGKYEGNIDFNDRYIVFAARKETQDHLTAILYDMQLDVIKATKDFPDALWPDNGQVFDWISVSPLGHHILMSSDDKIDQYDMNLNLVRHLTTSGGHGDLGVDQNGSEVYVQFEFYTEEYGNNNGIWIYRLSDGYRIRLLPDKYNGGHISCRNAQRQGWCYASTNAEGHKEVFAIKLDYSGAQQHIVNRFVQTHNTVDSFGNVSPDGRRVLFFSNWGNAALDWEDRDTYHVQLLQN